jgi:hypothetical protein
MTTQSDLDEMINKAKAVLYAINPDYAPDYVPPKLSKPLRIDASALKQTTLIDDHSSDTCAICPQPLPFAFGSGRPSIYCSDACKMKAYRQRKKQALRNTETNVKPLRIAQRPNVRVIGVSGTVHQFPVQSTKGFKAPAPYIRSFDELEKFFGGAK